LVTEEKTLGLGVPLSLREEEILSWLVQGKANAEIASGLGVSKATIKRHLENLYAKMEVRNRAAAVFQAIRSRPAVAPSWQRTKRLGADSGLS
jgi:DNA-binding CsgD family transcriptional regulator